MSESQQEKLSYPDYKYCIWLLPEGKFWYNINKSIIPHMSVKTHLSLSDALNLHKVIQKEMKHRFIKAKIDDNFLITNDDGFIALQYNLYYSENNIMEKPIWWPSGAHISTLYKYHQGVTDEEKSYMNKNCVKRYTRFSTPCIVHCKGHYRQWDIIKI